MKDLKARNKKIMELYTTGWKNVSIAKEMRMKKGNVDRIIAKEFQPVVSGKTYLIFKDKPQMSVQKVTDYINSLRNYENIAALKKEKKAKIREEIALWEFALCCAKMITL